MYGTRWYCTLYSGHVLPHHTLLRVWDILFLKGPETLVYIALSLLYYIQGIFQIAR